MSTQRQLYMYRAEWGKARKALRAAGKSPAECEEYRKNKIHMKAGAYWIVNTDKGSLLKIKSSKDLNNPELDSCLADFRAIYAADDLMLQLAQLDMPARRMLYATAELLQSIGIADEDDQERYLAGVARKPLADCDDSDQQRVIIAVNHTYKHKKGIAHNHPRTHKGNRAAHDHRVGSRKNNKNSRESGTLRSSKSEARAKQSTFEYTNENPF